MAQNVPDGEGAVKEGRSPAIDEPWLLLHAWGEKVVYLELWRIRPRRRLW